MGLSKLSEACKKCPNVDSCDHKRMEALGCLPSPEPSKAAEIRIDGMSLSSDLYKSLGKQYPLCKYYLREQKTTRLQNICNSDSDYAQFAEGV